MGGPLRNRLDNPKGKGRPASSPDPKPSAPVSEWTEAKVSAILAAFNTFLYNQAKKHGVGVNEVWGLIRDEVLDLEEDD